MITDSMTEQLIDLYRSDELTKKKRKIVKVIVDSLIEQLCRNYLNAYPSGIANVRAQINKHLTNCTEPEVALVLQSINNMLRAYHEAFNKSYSDHSDKFWEFTNSQLRPLLIILKEQELFNNIELSNQLRSLL